MVWFPLCTHHSNMQNGKTEKYWNTLKWDKITNTHTHAICEANVCCCERGKNHPSDTWRMLGKPFNCLYSVSTIQSLIMLISLRFFHNLYVDERRAEQWKRQQQCNLPGKRACVGVCVLKATRLFAETEFYGWDLLDNIAVWKMFQFVAVQNTQTHVHLHPHSHSISKVKTVLCKSGKWRKYLHQLFFLCVYPLLTCSLVHLFICSVCLNESVPSTRKMLLWWWWHCRRRYCCCCYLAKRMEHIYSNNNLKYA